MKNYIVDQQAKQLTMIDARFYFLGDKFYPSVTTILDAYPKDASFFKWLKEVGNEADTIRDEAGRRGSIVHDLTERYDNGEEVSLLNMDGNIKFTMREWSMFEKYVEFANRIKPTYLIVEQNYISPELGFAGTIDRLATIDGKNVLLDIKTSNNIHDTYWLQLAAYDKLITTNTEYIVDEVAILHLNAKTRTNGGKGSIQGVGWQLITRSRNEIDDDYELFCVTKRLWDTQNKDLKPRKSMYNIVYKKDSD
jgi:hypothetical protein